MAFNAYQVMMQKGLTAAASAFGDSAEEKAAYNAAYSATAKRLAARDRRQQAQSNIRAIRREKIMSNVKLEQNQAQAEAMVRVNAAAAGVSGGSLDRQIYTTEMNLTEQQEVLESAARQQIENQLGAINASTLDMMSSKNPDISFGQNLIGNAMEIDWFSKNEDGVSFLDMMKDNGKAISSGISSLFGGGE